MLISFHYNAENRHFLTLRNNLCIFVSDRNNIRFKERFWRYCKAFIFVYYRNQIVFPHFTFDINTAYYRTCYIVEDSQCSSILQHYTGRHGCGQFIKNTLSVILSKQFFSQSTKNGARFHIVLTQKKKLWNVDITS